MKRNRALKTYNPKKSPKHIFFFNVLPVALAASVLVGITGHRQLAAHVDASAKTSLPNIETIKKSIAADGGVFHVLEVTPEDKSSYLAQTTGNFGYLIEGQEPVNFEKVLGEDIEDELTADDSKERDTYTYDGDNDGYMLKTERERWAQEYLQRLEDAHILSYKENEAPLLGEKAEDGSAYKELRPWEKDVEGERTLHLKEKEAAWVIAGNPEKKDHGDYTPASTSYVHDEGADYVQNISMSNRMKKASELPDDADIRDYDFYRFTEDDFETVDFSKFINSAATGTSGVEAIKNQLKAAKDRGFPFIFSREDNTKEWQLDTIATGDFDDFIELNSYDTEKLRQVRLDHNIRYGYQYAVLRSATDIVTGTDAGEDVTISSLADKNYFAAKLDDYEPYVKTQNGMGHFRLDLSEFTYVGNGNGDYDLTVGSEDTSRDHTSGDSGSYTVKIYYDQVRYVGGYKNNNWFVKNVLDYSGDDINDKDISAMAAKIQVDCVTPEEVKGKIDADNKTAQTQDLSAYNLIVMNGGLDIYGDSKTYTSADAFRNVDLSELKDELNNFLAQKGALFIDESVLENTNMKNLLSTKEDDNVTYKYLDMSKAENTESCPDGTVYRSVYLFRGDNKKAMASSDFLKSFPDNESMDSASAFFDVRDEISNENALRVKKDPSTSDVLDVDVNEAAGIRYILNYSGQRSRVKKDSLRVLDIEPEGIEPLAASAADFKKNTIMKMLPGYKDSQVKVTTVATRTLAGLTDDINGTYDVVYIGDRNKKTSYRDNSMQGLAYYNIGDVYYCPNTSYAALNGMLDEEYDKWKGDIDTFRYSGNDISIAKENELKSFILQGFPVILGGSIGKDGAVNKGAVDVNTRMYQLLNDYIGRANVMTEAEALKSGAAVSYASLSTPVIHMISAPKQYDANKSDRNEIGGYEGDLKIQSEKKLDFTFQIVNKTDPLPESTTYTARIFADLNSDGVFSTSNEEITEVTVEEQNSGRQSAGSLKGNISESSAPIYKLSAQLPESLQGAFTWKFEIIENTSYSDDLSPKDTYKGVSFVGLNDKSKDGRIRINILQLNNKGNGDVYNLQKMLKDREGNFHDALTSDFIQKYYDLHITTIDATEADEHFRNNPNWKKYYDMIILGFGDAYDGLSRNVLTEIKSYAESGRSVLFCHDNSRYQTLNSANVPDGQRLAEWHIKKPAQTSGFDFDTILRATAHMDVYGISDIDSGFGGQKYWSYNSWYYNYVAIPEGILARGTSLSAEQQEQLKSLGYSVAYKPGSDHETLPYVQGFSDHATGNRVPLDNNGVMVNDNVSGHIETDRVDQVNKGQITTYPYDINRSEFSSSEKNSLDNGFVYTGDTGTSMTVSETHGQWFQLNTNPDDIVVWYTVENGKRTKIYGHDDCINDYYIYSCGNITYTGAGHDGYDGDVTKDEAELFVNTMIASFRVSDSKPKASFVSDKNGRQSIEEKSLKAMDDFSDTNASKTAQDARTLAVTDLKIYFKITDTNIASDKYSSASFFYKADSETDPSTNETSYTVDESDRLSGIRIYDAENDKKVDNRLKSNHVYYIKVPGNQWDSSGNKSNLYYQLAIEGKEVELYLKPTLHVGSGSAASEYSGDVVRLKISMDKFSLFDLG